MDFVLELAKSIPLEGRTIVAIGGPPGAGKTTVALDLAEALSHRKRHAVAVSMDGWHLSNHQLELQGKISRKGAPDTFDTDGLAWAIWRIKAQSASAPDIYMPTYSRDTMYASLGESCSRPEDESAPGVPDITKTALRGLHEEYGLSADASMIQWAALGADVDSGQYNLVGLVQLDMTPGEFARYLDMGEDSWEREENHAALFTPDGIANFIDKTGPWIAFGIATIQEALRARYGAVIRAATVSPSAK